jgi:hypothetical protein
MFARVSGLAAKRLKIDIAPNRRAGCDIKNPSFETGATRRVAAAAPTAANVESFTLAGMRTDPTG